MAFLSFEILTMFPAGILSVPPKLHHNEEIEVNVELFSSMPSLASLNFMFLHTDLERVGVK